MTEASLELKLGHIEGNLQKLTPTKLDFTTLQRTMFYSTIQAGMVSEFQRETLYGSAISFSRSVSHKVTGGGNPVNSLKLKAREASVSSIGPISL